MPGDIPAHGIFDAPREQAHHVAHVLRLAEGDALTVFDGRGLEYPGVIERIAKSTVTVRVGDPRQVTRESPLAVSLAQGISSGERWINGAEAVESGLGSVRRSRSSAAWSSSPPSVPRSGAAHWQGRRGRGGEQSGRNHVPLLLPVMPFTAWIANVASDALKLTLSPEAASTLRELERPQGEVVLLVGPEGGLSPREIDIARAAAFKPLRLGPRVLRTETAALAALAAMQVIWGDF